jgi:NAD(P)H-dependent FMN reductase
VRHLFHLRQVLSGLGVIVLPQQVQLARADQAFDADGALTDARAVKALATLARALTEISARLA